MNWRWLAFEKRRGHAVPEALAAAIIGDVGGTPIKDVPLIELHIDIGGGGYLNAPREHTEIDGLTIIVPSGDLPLLFAQLARITPREAGLDGSNYYKLYGIGRSLVLLPDQHMRLLTAWKTIAAEAEARAEAFFSRRIGDAS